MAPTRGSGGGTRRRSFVAAGGVMLLAWVLWMGFGNRSRVPEPSARNPGAAPGSMAGSGARGAPRGGAGAAPSSSTYVAVRASPSANSFGVPDPIRLTNTPPPYPPWCQPLAEGTDPAKTVKDDNPIDAKAGLHVQMGPRSFVVHPPDPIVIDLAVLNSLGAKLPIGNGVARFRPDGITITSGPWFEVPFVDDGTGADLGAGDHDYTAAFTPSDEQRAALFKGGEHVYVEVAFEAPENKGLMRYPLVVTYSREPDAKLNGKYSDAASGGGMVIDVGVTAEKAGHYRVIGSLYAADGERAIAFATAQADLGVGDGTLPLQFFGKVLRDSGIDGPYELRYEMLYEQIAMGTEIAGETVDPAYTTGPYKASSFSSDAYAAPELPVVDMNSPSQQGKPPPLFGDDSKIANHAVDNPPVTAGRGPPTK
jgi:hypothetical protein